MGDDFPEHDGAADNDHGKGQISIGINYRLHDNLLFVLISDRLMMPYGSLFYLDNIALWKKNLQSLIRRPDRINFLIYKDGKPSVFFFNEF